MMGRDDDKGDGPGTSEAWGVWTSKKGSASGWYPFANGERSTSDRHHAETTCTGLMRSTAHAGWSFEVRPFGDVPCSNEAQAVQTTRLLKIGDRVTFYNQEGVVSKATKEGDDQVRVYWSKPESAGETWVKLSSPALRVLVVDKAPPRRSATDAAYRREVRSRGRQIAELQAKVGMLNTFVRALLSLDRYADGKRNPVVERALVTYGKADSASLARGERLAITDIRDRLIYAQRNGKDVTEAVRLVDWVASYRGKDITPMTRSETPQTEKDGDSR